jgi:hypothetical protein
MAIEVCQNVSLLNGREPVFDKTTGNEITVEQMDSALREYYGVIQTIKQIKNGMIHVSLGEFLAMPTTGRTAIDIFGKVVEDVKSTT